MADALGRLNNVQFSVIQGRTVINKTEGKLMIENYEFQSLLQDGTIIKKIDGHNKSLWRVFLSLLSSL